MLYNTVWKPAVEYTLPQSFLSTKQLEAIEKENMSSIYAKCGYNRKTSRKVLQGPLSLGGGGFTPLYATALAGSIMHFLKNWRSPTEQIGKVTQAVYAWAQANAGVSFSLFEKPHIPVPHLQGKVINSIQKFLAEVNARITLDTAYIRHRLRTNDIPIMEIALSMDLTTNQLQRVNAV